MFDHVEIAVKSMAESQRFFSSILGPTGISETFVDKGNGTAGFGTGDMTQFLIFESDLGLARFHICFSAASREQVNAAYSAGILAGGRDNGGPGYRDHYCPGYYAAFLLDPDGNNVEVLYREQ
jgi:catechol 2,3-dioxygenase-like lactoylglutathione lyase family enzyme